VAKDGGPSGARRATSTGVGPEREKPARRARIARTPAGQRKHPESVQAPQEASRNLRPRLRSRGPRLLRVIEPPAPGLRRYAADVWRHRSAFRYFVRLYILKRTGRTFLGYLWLALPLLIPLFMGALVFGGILGVSPGRVPYILYFAVAMSAWLLFSQTAYLSTRSLEIARKEIRRVYVPRLIPLTAGITLPLIAALVYMVFVAATVLFYVLERGEFYLVLGPATLLVPVGLAMLVVFAWACALWFAPLAPRARDVRRLTGYVLAVWYFLTPVIYPIEEIPAGWRTLASLNPITAPIELVKKGLIDIGEVTSLGVAIYFAALVVVSVAGLRIFLPKERRDMTFY
jgi:lipopolysaccharide transport system permease protein